MSIPWTSPDYSWALVIFLAHHHSGQGSRGYRLLSFLMERWRPTWTSATEAEVMESDEYLDLVYKYADKV
jgi:hypothetical protein